MQLHRTENRSPEFVASFLCFFPAAIGKEDDYVLQTRKLSAERIARQNPAFDTDRDGRITAGEFRRRLPKLFPDEFRSILF